ncbi:MAG: hypothetical protein GX660_00950 [Clostridiaceae bacterium]|nr:hypothetical protein [Clostridiaceae bacterium]
MGKRMRFTGNWTDGKKEIIVNLPMILFVEDNSTIIYCPALEISGYGKEEDEAKISFETSLVEFFRYTMNKGTFSSEMERLGWKIRSKGKPYTPPSLQQLLDSNDNFSRIFNTFSFRKFDSPVTLPAVA